MNPPPSSEVIFIYKQCFGLNSHDLVGPVLCFTWVRRQLTFQRNADSSTSQIPCASELEYALWVYCSPLKYGVSHMKNEKSTV